jgi:PERQ amino acid-rich with GYF domain-containing protein
VNSPLKPPQAATKDGNAAVAGSGRKTSISGHLGSFSIGTSNASRPGPRRREASESFNGAGPLSPTGNSKFFRDEPSAATPPAALLRRKTDFRDESFELPNDQKDSDGANRNAQTDLNTTFATLKRSTTGPLGGGLGGSSASPWSSGVQGGGFAPMGAFGSFAVGSSPASQDSAEKRPGFGSARGGSRFKDLLARTSAEEASPSIKEKGSLASLERLPETENEGDQFRQNEILRNRPARSETNPYGDMVPRSGSAALGGAQDASPPIQGIDQLGFSAFGLPSNIGARDFMQPGQQSSLNQTPQPRHHSQEPMSPTVTNPYRSPGGERGDASDDDTNDPSLQHSGILSYNSAIDEARGAPFASMRRGLPSSSEDRGQTPSSGPGRTFGALGGLGGSGPWPTTGFGAGTPNRDRPAFSPGFGDQLFASMGELQSPSLGLGSNNLFGSPGLGSSGPSGRSSKLGPLFPPAMQEQMRSGRVGTEGSDDVSERQHGDSETRNMGTGAFDNESHFSLRGGSMYDDNHSMNFASQPIRGPEDPGMSTEGTALYPRTSAAGPSQIPISTSSHGQHVSNIGDTGGQSGQGLSQSSGSSSSNQLPATQQRQMVMPDRMRWIYRDPQGNTQGPWSGLEMHDWFKAGFFTAELQVNKLEDTDYEPLAQLVRRIGNSREPFLVPQIGVPHGPAVTSPGNQWGVPAAPTTLGTVPPSSGAAQPPFASSFPSFGTTLTAEQQNALERRKQEEQYLMARQKEHLAQQQVLMKQMQIQGGPHALHSLQHHSSAQSLHSQPSFGSITSPSGVYQPSPMQGPIQPPSNVPGFFESSTRQAPTSNMGQAMPGGDMRGPREDDVSTLVERMSFNQRAPFPFGPGSMASQIPEGAPTTQQISSMLQDRARLQMEQYQADMKAQSDASADHPGQSERLREFHALRAQANDSIEGLQQSEGSQQQPIGAPSRQRADDQLRREQGADAMPAPIGTSSNAARIPPSTTQAPDITSLTQQVQKAAATSAQQHTPTGFDAHWGQADSMLPARGIPPPSVSPLPAPAAQRSRNVADALVVESRSQNQTPIETPTMSLAPWAEKSSEAPKGPSLKEIQEAEARKAAQQEEIAAAARRAQAEQERLVQPVAPAPGLPSTSTWAASTSPATPTTPGLSVWAKSASGKPVASPVNAKKTLAQIQKEEETRKQRAAAAVAQKSNTIPVAAGGTRYADLASKIATPSPTGPASPWTTVGSSGKAKAPATVVATPQAVPRATSATAPGLPTTARTRPAAPPARSSAALTSQSKAADEFTKWTKSALGKGLNNNMNGNVPFVEHARRDIC